MKILDCFEDGWKVDVAWEARGGQVILERYTQDKLPPEIFRCVEEGCTRTGFSLVQIVSRAREKSGKHRWVRHGEDVECMGSVMGETDFRGACRKVYHVEILGRIRTK